MTALNELELIELARLGDKNAFSSLVFHHQSAIRAYVAMRLSDKSEVDDLAQETFIIAFRKLSELDKPSAIRSWLIGIANNLIRNHVRRFAPTKSGGYDEIEAYCDDYFEHWFELEQTAYDLEQLKACIGKLKSKAQELLSQHYQQELPVAELTKIHQTKHSTMTMRLHRIREALRTCVEQKRQP